MELLRTKIGGIDVPCCIYNASGPRTGSTQPLQNVGQSAAGAILSKSATLLAQDGNPLPRYINKIDLGSEGNEGSVNSEGLPNYGIDYYISKSHVAEMNSFGKPYFVSISGLSLADNLEMLSRIFDTDGVAAIELNLACPNIPGKPTIAYDFEQMEQVLDAVTKLKNFKKKPLGVKLAPYFDMPHMELACKIISKYPIAYVVCINTIGNALFVDVDRECASITGKGGFGGLGGGYVKHTALANVKKISQTLHEMCNRPDIDVVGVGGVYTGKDAFEMILCGAAAVQVGSCHWTEGPGCFKRIAGELEAIMKKKGYTSIQDFRGKIKPVYVKSSTVKKRDEKKANHVGVTSLWQNIAPLAVAAHPILWAIIIYLWMEMQKMKQGQT